MATLTSDGLSLELAFRDYHHKWLRYTIRFCWQGEDIVRDALLRRNTTHWRSRPAGAFIAEDCGEDNIIALLSRVLEADKGESYTTLDPDLTMAVHPGTYPPYPGHDEPRGFPDDFFTIVVVIDSYNLEGATLYGAGGIALHLHVTRADLTDFRDRLAVEYKVLQATRN